MNFMSSRVYDMESRQVPDYYTRTKHGIEKLPQYEQH